MDDKHLVLGLLESAARVQRRLDRSLSFTLGISYTEYLLLAALAERPGCSATRVELAERVGLTPSAVTRAIKPLEKIGLMTTRRGERDARQNLAILTPAATELLENAEGILSDSISGLPLADVDRAELSRFIAALG